MKYDSLKKVHTKLSYNRYLYYEPKSAQILKQQSVEKGSSVLFGTAVRLIACGLIFGILMLFNQIPYLKNVSAGIKSVVKQNFGIFQIEQPGTIPIKDKIMQALYPDKTPLSYSKPVITQDIQYNDYCAVLKVDKNPLVYSVESGKISNVIKNDGIITVEIKHRNNTISRYEGLEFVGVKIGQTVNKNFPIGIVNNNRQLKFFLTIDKAAIKDINAEVQWD